MNPDTDPLRDALSEAWDKVESGTEAEPIAAEPASPEPVPTEETASEARARDEQGRFAKEAAEKKRETLRLKKGDKDAAKEPKSQGAGVQPAVEQHADAQPAQPGDGAASSQPGKPAASIPAPQHWSGDGKLDWHKLPAAVKESITKDYESVSALRDVQPAIQHFAPLLMQRFGHIGNGLGSVLTTWQQFQTNPLDTIRQLMQQSGIQPHQLAGAYTGQQSDPGQGMEQAAPQYVTQQDMAAMLERRERETQQRFFAQQIDSEVKSFGNAANTDGSPKYPYFNDVKAVMAGLFSSGAAQTLDDAYDKAVYANPHVRQKLLVQQQAEADAKRRKTAQEAQGAAAPVTGAPGHRGPGKPSNETVEQTLMRNLEKAYSWARA